jgi:hypothetical protein
MNPQSALDSVVETQPSTFPFLRLPAELRNRVYYFALRVPDGLRFSILGDIYDDPNVPVIDTDSLFDSDSDRESGEEDAEDEDSGDEDEGTKDGNEGAGNGNEDAGNGNEDAGNGNEDAGNGNEGAEDKNEDSEDEEIVDTWSPTQYPRKLVFHTPLVNNIEYEPAELNQLQYTCRQLRHETDGLEMLINKEVTADLREPFYEAVEKMLKHIRPSQLKHLSTVIMENEPYSDHSGFGRYGPASYWELCDTVDMVRSYPQIAFKTMSPLFGKKVVSGALSHTVTEKDLKRDLSAMSKVIHGLRGYLVEYLDVVDFVAKGDITTKHRYFGHDLHAPNLRHCTRRWNIGYEQLKRALGEIEGPPTMLNSGESLRELWLRYYLKWSTDGY